MRLALLMVLYLFLWQLVVVVWKDLHRPGLAEKVPPRATAQLVVLDGGGTSLQPGHAFPLAGTATIGRGAENSIVLGDGFVSTSHASVGYRDGIWWLADLDSRNGTSVNGERIKGEVQLQPGDVIAIGQVKLKLLR